MKISNPPTRERRQFIGWIARSKIGKADKGIGLVSRLSNRPGTIVFSLRTSRMICEYIEPALVLLNGICPIIFLLVSARDCQFHFRNRSRIRNHIHEPGEEISGSAWVAANTDGLASQQHRQFSMKTVWVPIKNSSQRIRSRGEIP